MENNQNTPKKTDRFKGLEFAGFLILLGLLFLFFNVGIIPVIYKPILISWQMLLLVTGIWLLAKKWYTGGVITTLLGAFFLCQKLSVVFPEYFAHISIDFKTYWPVLLILLGIILIVAHIRHPRKKFRHAHRYRYGKNQGIYDDGHAEESNTTDYIDKSMMFGSSRQIILSSDFKGGKIDLMFGELILDLRKSTLAEGTNYLEVNVMFGNVVVHVPSDWMVELRAETLLGNFQDNRNDVKMPEEGKNTRLIVKGSSVFGNGEIQY